jgi:hypothetical protein
MSELQSFIENEVIKNLPDEERLIEDARTIKPEFRRAEKEDESLVFYIKIHRSTKMVVADIYTINDMTGEIKFSNHYYRNTGAASLFYSHNKLITEEIFLRGIHIL